MKTLRDIISLYLFRKRWRKKNRHNNTVAGKVFNIKKVYVGNYTYGTINCLTWGCGNEKLKIGNLCSIAQEVMFLLGADHHTNHVSSYPFKSKMRLGERRQGTVLCLLRAPGSGDKEPSPVSLSNLFTEVELKSLPAGYYLTTAVIGDQRGDVYYSEVVGQEVKGGKVVERKVESSFVGSNY